MKVYIFDIQGGCRRKIFFLFFSPWLMLQVSSNHMRCASCKIIYFSFCRSECDSINNQNWQRNWVAHLVTSVLHSSTDAANTAQVNSPLWESNFSSCLAEVSAPSQPLMGGRRMISLPHIGLGKLCQAANTVTLTFSAWPREREIHLMTSPVLASIPTRDQ